MNPFHGITSEQILSLEQKDYLRIKALQDKTRNLVRMEVNEKLRKTGDRSAFGSGGTCNSLEISNYLSVCHSAVCQWLSQQAEELHPVVWHWRLRNLPAPVFGADAIQQASVSDLADTFTGNSTAAGPPDWSRQVLEHDPGPLEPALKLVEGAKILYHIHQLANWCSRGSRLAFKGRSDTLPILEITSAEKESDDLFRRRLERAYALMSAHSMPIASAGIPLGRTNLDFKPSDISDSIFIVRRIMPPVAFEMSKRPFGHDTPHIGVARFILDPITLDRLRVLNQSKTVSDAQWWDDAAPHLMMVLRIGSLIAAESHRGTLYPAGLFFSREAVLLKSWSELFSYSLKGIDNLLPGAKLPRTPEELVSELETVHGLVRPIVPGPVIRRLNDILCVDLYAASKLLDHALEFPRTITGAAAQVRGRQLEPHVQSVINNSLWKPGEKLASIVGRKLKRKDGTDITDVDAIGESGDTLLFVSAKGFITSSEYFAGDFRALRRLLTDVERAHADLRGKIAQLSDCTSFDFSCYKKVIATVCTYNPIWTPVGPLTQEVAPGLLPVTSINELAHWCASLAAD